LGLILALSVLAAAYGCGIESVGPGEPQPIPPPPISIVGGAGENPTLPDYPGIIRTVDATGNARYLGEVQNQGDEIACNIRITVNSSERVNPPVNADTPDAPENFQLLTNPANQQFGFADLLGESMQYSSFATATIETCLSPGHRATFDIRNDFPLTRVAKIVASTTCDGTLYQGCLSNEPGFVPPTAAVVLSGRVNEDVTGDGHVLYTGIIRNQSPSGSLPAYHIKIFFTTKNADGRVVDVACATIDGAVCPAPNGSTGSPSGLGPGDTWTFSVPMSIGPDTTCPGCFSYLINYNPSP
jgi:hypothetical protein